MIIIEDDSGAIEYYYGKMGEVTKTVRTLIVPNQAVATYVTQWKYDSHNRLLEMIYPDEGKVTYGYDYVTGQGFCCNNGTPKVAQARAMARTRAANDNFHDKDNYEKMQFYYHPDHLGSSSYITNLDGEVSQHIEYVPFGEVFIEERNNTWNTPYLFNDCANEGRGKLACSMPSAANRRVKLNAKELDVETGMYYYGARYYEPRLSLWMSVDRFAEKYPATSGYNYAINNPVRYIDINGDSIRVSSENRELFNKTLKDVFGEFSSKFSYTQSDMLVFSGENKGMGKAQRKVFKRLKEVIIARPLQTYNMARTPK